MVSVRLVTADSYQAQPLPQLDPSFSEFRGSEIKHVPVIRIFGTTMDGEKTCLHVHGVFPYLFVPYTGEEDPQILAYRLAASLDAAINVSLGSATSNVQHVYSIQRVSGTPFYGYHKKEHQFFKIYFYNPAMIKRAADLLQNGSVLNQSLQPHEAHINYILQFMMDYNIYGMSFVNLRSVKHRRVTQTLGVLASSGQSVSSENSEIIYLPMEIERQSTCELEIDAHASDILNRLEIDKNLELNPGLAAIWDEERTRRAQAGFQGGDSQLVNPKSPARPPFHPTDNDIYQDQRLVRRLLMISQSDDSTLSTTPDRSVAYAAEVRDGENLLNASWVPNVSVERIERMSRDQIEDSLENPSFIDVSMMPGSQILTQEHSILGVDDMPLVDLLAQLAGENEENCEIVDSDSLLGSQRSVLLDESDKIEKEDEDEDEDIEDLNLTSLDLDSLSSFENVSEKQGVRNSGIEKNETNALIVSPFLSPWEETPSCSPKSMDDVGEANDLQHRLPQYDGAGDVSPNLLRSGDEDKEENTNNAKELDRLSDFNCSREATDPRTASRVNDAAKENTQMSLTPNITSPLEIAKNTESFQNSSAQQEVLPEETCSEIADMCVGHYCVVGYEPFDRMLEMGNDLIPDLADMQSSMEIDILMSREDSEKAESIGEISNVQNIILETVLNGDPCFTESAEVDKSDVTELHDQYVSLLGNALLPDLPRINNDLDEASTFTERQFGTIDKASEVSSHSRYECTAIGSPDSSSSSENVAPNVQKRHFHELPHPKTNDVIDDCEPSSCKEQTRLANDTADYNCNVVATWAELQNLQIIDKSEDGRTRRKNRKLLAGPRSMKRRSVPRFRSNNVTSQVFRENNTEKIPFIVSNDPPCSLQQSSQHSVSENPSNVITLISGMEENTTEQTRIVIGNDSEQLCSLLTVPKTSQFLNEDSSENLPTTPGTDNIATDTQPVISSDDRSAEITSEVPAYSLTESFVVSSLGDCNGTSLNHIQSVEGALSIDCIDNDESINIGTSFYCSKRSDNLPDDEDRRHRHCVISQFNKTIQSHVFTSDELWIIHNKQSRRGTGTRAKFDSTETVCTSQVCKLPVVPLKKVEQRANDEIIDAAESHEIVVDKESAEIVAEKVSPENFPQENLSEKKESPENVSLPVAIPTEKQNVDVPNEKPKRRRRKRELALLTSNKPPSEEPANIGSSTSTTETKLNNAVPEDCSSNNLQHTGEYDELNRLKRGTYNTRRRPIVENLARQRRRIAKKFIESEDETEKKAKPKVRKEPKLPGIPGIPKEMPVKRRRSKKNKLGKPKDSQDTEALAKVEEPAQETPKNSTNNAFRKAQINGFVSTKQNVEISQEKSQNRNLESDLTSPIIPKKKSGRRRRRKNSVSKHSYTSSITEIPEEPERDREPRGVCDPSISPETAALSSMLQSAKPSSMRTKIKLLLRKRINEKNGDTVERKFTIKTYPREEKKVVSDRVSDESSPEILNHAPSFETVTDSSTDMFEKTQASSGSLENVRNFDGTTSIIEYCDPPADIFDNEASVDSVINGTQDVTEFSNGPEKSVYDTDRYENAIKEANFFAGKDYSIDAVSNEIPTCLFEEDSNSTDKRLSKRTNDDFDDNLLDYSIPRDVETISELSVDPRDLDVYDVQSLTSSSSISNLDETNDMSESSQHLFHDYETRIPHADTHDLANHENSSTESILNASSEKTATEDYFNGEKVSSSSKHLRDSQIVLSISPLIENELTVHPKSGDPKNQNTPGNTSKITRIENVPNTVENYLEQVTSVTSENSPISITREKSPNPPINVSSETVESFFNNLSHEKSGESLEIISAGTFENSYEKPISITPLPAVESHKISETNRELNSPVHHSTAQAANDLGTEREVLQANEKESSTDTDRNINFPENMEKNEPLPTDVKNKNLSLNPVKLKDESTVIEECEKMLKTIEPKKENRIPAQNDQEFQRKTNAGRQLRSLTTKGTNPSDNAVANQHTKTCGEGRKLPRSSERRNKSSVLSVSGPLLKNSGKHFSQRFQLDIRPSETLVITKFSESPKVSRELESTFENKLAEENELFLSAFEEKSERSATTENGLEVANIATIGTRSSMISNSTESFRKVEKEKELRGTAEKNQTSATVVQFPSTESGDEHRRSTEKIIVRECKRSDEQPDSKVEKTDEKCENVEFNVRSENNGIQENTKNISVDINKNDVVATPERENRESKIPQERKEYRPFSIKVNVDLAKISCLSPNLLLLQQKNTATEKEKLKEQRSDNHGSEKLREQSTKVNERDESNEKLFKIEGKEKLDDESSTGNESEEISESSVEPMSSYTSDVDNFTDPETLDSVEKQIRKRRRRIAKNTRIPERRSVRICAEMTLKLCQEESSTTIPTEAVKEEMPKTVATTDSEEEKAENVRKITEAPTRPEAISPVQESKTRVSQDLILAEQTLMDGNSAPVKTKRGESRRKILQTNCQEMLKITDENTAPTFDNPARKMSRINVHETVDDLKSSKPMEKKVVENMPPEIEVQPVDLPLKISETQVESENSISPKRFRRNMNQGLTPSVVPPQATGSLNDKLKNVFVLDKNEESRIEPEAVEEPDQKIKKEFTQNNRTKQNVGKNVNVMTKIPLLTKLDLSREKINSLNNPPVRKRGRPRNETKNVAQKPSAEISSPASVGSRIGTLDERLVAEDNVQSSKSNLPDLTRSERGKIGVRRKHTRLKDTPGKNSLDSNQWEFTEEPLESKSSMSQTSNKSQSELEISTPRRHRSTKILHTNSHKISSAQTATNKISLKVVKTTSEVEIQKKSKKAHTNMKQAKGLEGKTQEKRKRGPGRPRKIQGRSRKRVHFDEDSIRSTESRLTTESSSDDATFVIRVKKYYKKSETNCSLVPTKRNLSDGLNVTSLYGRLACRKKDVNRVSRNVEPVDSEPEQKVLQAVKLVLKHARKWDDCHDSKLSQQSEITSNSHTKIQLKKPVIRLKRLTRKSLKLYGIVYNPKEKKFLKMSSKAERIFVEEAEADGEEFRVPAYDGAADLSSSEEEEDPDVTIAREEKRVCTYSSSKKSVSKGETVVKTPLKRKLEMEVEVLSPKRQVLGSKLHSETPKKGSFNSPHRTSTLKTPGRNPANYSPLKIIVTSPKVRKDKLEPKQSCSGKLDDEVKASSSDTTPSRKNSRLHDTMLRGRINSVKSSLCELGDERASVGKVGSKAVGELDEIRSIGQINDEMSHLSPRLQRSGMLLEIGKDVRKKLSFLDQDSNECIDELSAKKVQEEERTEPRIISKDVEASKEMTDNGSSIDVPVRLKREERITTMEAVPGPSRSSDNSDRSALHETETQFNSDENENDDDVCNVTFTQFIETQKSQEDATSFMCLEGERDEFNKKIIIIPKFKPPSRERVVETMEQYGIKKFRNQEPFFSESVDVPKQKELAHKILRVPGKGVEFLPQFVSSLEEVTGIGRWRKMWLNEFHPSLARTKESTVKVALASNGKIHITPLAHPPSQKQVKDWLRARDYLNKKKATNEKPKIEAEKQTVSEIQGRRQSTGNFVASPQPSPERTLVSEDLEKTGNTTLVSKSAQRDLLKSCAKDPGTGSQVLENSIKESSTNSSNSAPDPSLLNVLQKSRLFRDQETSRHLGISCGQIEFLSDSTRSNVTNENLQKAKALIRYQYLTIMCLEVHVVTRGDLLPDAQHDPIAAIFYSVQNDVPPESSIKPLEHGALVVADSERATRKMYYSYASNVPWKISFVNNEEALLNALVTLITRTDPEILIGWEIEVLSWGYVFQRASSLGMNLLKRVSRIPATQYKWEYEAPDIEKLAEVKLPGRIVLDIWRLMRREAALLSYTFENVMHHVLNERIPCPSFKVLTDWWNLENHPRPSRWRVVEHYGIRVLGVLRMLDQLDMIGRTSELARLFGIQFFEVFSRGSQFRVESVMLRLAKPLNYIAVSPSAQQRASMRAMEALPLILEPESMLYSDPLIVLDFQSLYPSIIIAYNICFSTCLGRIEHIGQPQPFEFGAYTLRVPKKTAQKLHGKVNYAPCGVAFVKPEVRLGILPRMLTEILETRFMVKKAMKDHDKNDKTLQRALHSRQMGLKFLANVTYGYTAANFSGRMPCIEVGDSVISKSKETLERAIKLVEATPKWGARVVYGDTDSLFILVPGKSKDEAFVIGNEIADAVTASNPPPIKLKFEKVLYPAILQTKKRYCGFMYETPDQKTPTYLAKGIETVRRDGCPAVSKILEKTLRILFETKDVSLVKKYVTRQLDKVLRGKVSIQDLTFAKEFRGLKGYKAKACVPTLELTRRLMRKDPRAVPRTSERVRYVIVAGAPNQALIHCVRSPWELMRDPGLRPNAIYYVTRVIIPPLNRCLNLMGVDVHEWYKEMPHRQILDNPVGQPSDKQKLTIFQYFGTIVCVACGLPSNKGICTKCLKRPADTLVAIHEKLRWLDRTNNHVTAICQSCVGQGDAADCGSLDCPVLYRRAQAERELSQAIQLQEIIRCGNNLEF
ncbi:uncharacterized protein DNApol-zeta isoform X2 [Venturia canescens]|uniref:uncharacterized protein DNApol-zeta isoform X2 n=1 Tax=Venturia canescens TaxID=32260 RepID=UPI001C9D20A3|nr:uncharacterized protein LOC122405716 isoform X2 [Venturia canescens]